jgi:hypothetical protein
MSGTVNAGLVPSIEKDTTTTIPSTSAFDGVNASAADSEVYHLTCGNTSFVCISS